MTVRPPVVRDRLEQPSHSGLQPKGDYDDMVIVVRAPFNLESHSGLQPKGDYDVASSASLLRTFWGPIADFSRKAIMTC